MAHGLNQDQTFMFGPDTAELLLRISTIRHTMLDISRLKIVSLPELPETITYLDCEGTQISVLPDLPKTLTYLNCSHTQISVLPKLPETLTHLDCSYTQISVLPKLPETLVYLNCSYTQISVPACSEIKIHTSRMRSVPKTFGTRPAFVELPKLSYTESVA